MSFVSSIVGGLLGANAAGNASQAEQQGAQQAQTTIANNQGNANQAQQTALGNVTTAQQPYQQLGSTAAGRLNTLLQNGFQAPTLAQAQQTPGYQFQLQQGTQAIDENAAANGTLMSGNTGTALQNYGQGLAQNAYQSTYQNALNSYMANANTLQSGVNSGLSSTGQLSQANLQTAGNTANIDMTAGQQIAQQQNNAAAARAQGILGQAAGYAQIAGGGISGVGSAAQGLSGGGGLSDVESSLLGG
jgi:ElaB/YqjD/DUF883 family membrane-anchored ribosome-binding protein